MNTGTDRWVGIAYGIAAGMMFGVMYGAIRLLAHRGCSAAGMALSRGVLGTLVLFPFAAASLRSIFSRAALSVWARSAAGAIALVLQFVGLQYAATAFVRSMTDFSVVLSAVLAASLYKERLQASGWVGIVVVSGSVLGLSLLNYSAGATPIVVGVASAIATTAAFLALRRSSMKFSPAIVVWCYLLDSVSLLAATWLLPTPRLGMHSTGGSSHSWPRQA